MKLYQLLIVFLFCVAAGCKKKEYPVSTTTTDNPFYLKLLVDNKPLEITAGKDNYFMYSSFTLDTSNVYKLYTEFKQAGCSNCTNSLKILINDTAKSSPSNTININSLLQVRNYQFVAGANDRVQSKIVIEFRDETGKFYTSNHASQPQSSVLEVISVEDYVGDGTNKNVKRAKVKFNCKMFSGSQSIDLVGTDVEAGLVIYK